MRGFASNSFAMSPAPSSCAEVSSDEAGTHDDAIA